MLFIRVKLRLLIWDREAIILPIMRIFVQVGLNALLVIANPWYEVVTERTECIITRQAC